MSVAERIILAKLEEATMKSHLEYDPADVEDEETRRFHDEHGFNAVVNPDGTVIRGLEPHNEMVDGGINAAIQYHHVRATVYHDSEEDDRHISQEIHVEYLHGSEIAKQNAIGFIKDWHRPRYKIFVDAIGKPGSMRGHKSVESAVDWIKRN